MGKNPSAKAGNIRDPSSIPGLGRSPGAGHGNPLQYSCLDNPMDRGAWWAAVTRIAKSLGFMSEATEHAHARHSTNIVQCVYTGYIFDS